MNRIRKVVVVLTAAAVISACGSGSGTDAEHARKKKRCSSSHTCEKRVVKRTCDVDQPGCELGGNQTGEGSTGDSGGGKGGGGSTIGVIVDRRTVTVPKVVDIQADPAVQLLEALGLHSAVTPRYVTLPGDAGKVVVQNPAPFTRVARGTTVGLTVTTFDSSQLRVIPDLTGKSEQDAKSTLTNMGLAVSVKTLQTGVNSNLGARSSDPAKGSTVLVGSTVSVVIAVWSPTNTVSLVTVPNIIGVHDAYVPTQLHAVGLQADMHQVHVNSPAWHGVCFQQSPAAGTRVPQGSTVTYNVGIYP